MEGCLWGRLRLCNNSWLGVLFHPMSEPQVFLLRAWFIWFDLVGCNPMHPVNLNAVDIYDLFYGTWQSHQHQLPTFVWWWRARSDPPRTMPRFHRAFWMARYLSKVALTLRSLATDLKCVADSSDIKTCCVVGRSEERWWPNSTHMRMCCLMVQPKFTSAATPSGGRPHPRSKGSEYALVRISATVRIQDCCVWALSWLQIMY